MSYEFTGGYKIRDQAATHFLTFSIMGWIDIFSRQRYRNIILESTALRGNLPRSIIPLLPATLIFIMLKILKHELRIYRRI